MIQELFADYGVLGLLCGVLLYYGYHTMSKGTAVFVEEVRLSREDAKQFRAEHREERSTWLLSQERRDDKLEIAFREVTQAIRDQGASI